MLSMAVFLLIFLWIFVVKFWAKHQFYFLLIQCMHIYTGVKINLDTFEVQVNCLNYDKDKDEVVI